MLTSLVSLAGLIPTVVAVADDGGEQGLRIMILVLTLIQVLLGLPASP